MIDDPFAWRSGGGAFEFGDNGDEGNLSTMIPSGDAMLVVMRKAIYTLLLADTIDPKRTNPNIRHSKQKLLSLGSDDALVGRTLLQANALLDGSSPVGQRVNTNQGIDISLSLLKELVPLEESAKRYQAKEENIQASYGGKLAKDGTLSLPSISTVVHETQQFIRGVDNAIRHLIEIVQLFYPDIANTNWVSQLKNKFVVEGRNKDGSNEFVEALSRWTWLIRNLRNAIEHPKPDDFVKINDYTLVADGVIKPPTIVYTNKNTPQPEITVSVFMISNIENIQIAFESLLACLCGSIPTSPKLGEITFAPVEIPESERKEHERHVRFSYRMFTSK